MDSLAEIASADYIPDVGFPQFRKVSDRIERQTVHSGEDVHQKVS